MLLVEHYVHISDGRVPLSMAQKAADELLESQTWQENGSVSAPVVPQAPTAAENDAALAALQSMIGGVK